VNVSESIQISFQNLITIYQETASLLQDAESLLELAGYSCPHGTTLGTIQSKGINNPTGWIVPFASRYFTRKDKPLELKAIGIFFVNPAFEPIEPLILSACFRMKSDFNPQKDYEYWYLKNAWFYRTEEEKINTLLPFEGEKTHLGGEILAVRLADVTDQSTLEELVVAPLLSMSC
jgi:hypothetical protein